MQQREGVKDSTKMDKEVAIVQCALLELLLLASLPLLLFFYHRTGAIVIVMTIITIRDLL